MIVRAIHVLSRCTGNRAVRRAGSDDLVIRAFRDLCRSFSFLIDSLAGVIWPSIATLPVALLLIDRR